MQRMLGFGLGMRCAGGTPSPNIVGEAGKLGRRSPIVSLPSVKETRPLGWGQYFRERSAFGSDHVQVVEMRRALGRPSLRPYQPKKGALAVSQTPATRLLCGLQSAPDSRFGRAESSQNAAHCSLCEYAALQYASEKTPMNRSACLNRSSIHPAIFSPAPISQSCTNGSWPALRSCQPIQCAHSRSLLV